MFSQVNTFLNHGYQASAARIESTVLPGLPSFTFNGIERGQARETEGRLRSAFVYSGFRWPKGRIISSLSPNWDSKGERNCDLPVALSILQASGQIPECSMGESTTFVGELGLDGRIYGGSGAFPVVEAMSAEESVGVFSVEYRQLTQFFPGMKWIAVRTLSETVDAWKGLIEPEVVESEKIKERAVPLAEELRAEQVLRAFQGQETALRAFLISLSGWHPLLLIGSPGCGKSMLASTARYLLPALREDEMFTLRKLYSVAEKYDEKVFDFGARPYIAPHHSVTASALIGGGAPIKPGLLSLAHGGVLFLDELNEIKENVINLLREPLENAEIHIARSDQQLSLPADCLLIAAANPCPCGFAADNHYLCRCQPYQIKKQIQRISGPIMDRFHLLSIMLHLPVEDLEKLSGKTNDKSFSLELKNKIKEAHERQYERQVFLGEEAILNGRNRSPHRFHHWQISDKAKEAASKMAESFHLTARSYCSLLAVSRTIADLDKCERILEDHVVEAICYRVNLEEKIGVEI